MADLLANYWVLLGLKLVAITAVIPNAALVVGFAELKLSAKMQNRMGPYFAGGRFGWAQLIADGVKFLQKEDIIPEDADRQVFRWAPAVVLLGTFALFVVIPFWPSGTFRGEAVPVGAVQDLDLGIFYLLAVSSISTIGVLMAGWSSANKYSLIGGLRAAGQLIAYELPLVLSVIGVVILSETMSLGGIIDAQASFEFWPGSPSWLNLVVSPFAILQVVGLVIFYISALAELSRTPFDMPIAESELVTGYLTEYTGFRFLFFFLAEYANMFAMSAIAATLFLGGPLGPGVEQFPWLGPIWLVSKVLVLAFIMIWFRWTFPRFREDQLQRLAWQWLVPIGLMNIVATAVLKVVF